MKTKPLTIVLLSAVILIWAWIMYSVFDYTNSPEIATSKKKTIASVLKEDSIVSDYVLVFNYKDPFLKKEYYSLKNTNNLPGQNQSNSQQNNVATVTRKKIEQKPVKEEILIPVIEYVGRIQNTKLNKPIAILLIADHEYMMQEGQEINGVMLKQITNDSVKVVFFKKIFYVKKH